MLCKTSDLAWRTGLFGHWGLQAYLGRQNNSNTGIPYCDHTDLSFPLSRILLIQKTPARRCKKYPVLTGLNRRKALLRSRTRCTAVLPSAGFDKTQSSAPDCKGQVWEQDTQVLTVHSHQSSRVTSTHLQTRGGSHATTSSGQAQHREWGAFREWFEKLISQANKNQHGVTGTVTSGKSSRPVSLWVFSTEFECQCVLE